MHTPASTAKVIRLTDYLSRRAPGDLPLFARPLSPDTTTVTPVRRLSSREIEHRARMLAHLQRA